MERKKLDLDHKLILGPMAGVTDLPFRLLCKEQQCDIVYTEMVSAKAIYYGNKNTEPLLETDSKEKPVFVQIFGSDPKIMAEQAKRIEDRGYADIDINMGCPVPKIVNNQEGSALMKNPELIGEIVNEIVNTVSLPVTIKIRAGFDEKHKNAVEVAKIAQEAGASAIAVHGRTREQYYSGKADWEIIREVKQNVSIPVIGNGDVVDGPSAKKMYKETGCDSLMIGRAAKGNPWIFSQIRYFLENGIEKEKPDFHEVMQMIRKHISLMCEYKGEFVTVREMRKHIAWYTAGYPSSSLLRAEVNKMESIKDLLALLEKYEERL